MMVQITQMPSGGWQWLRRSSYVQDDERSTSAPEIHNGLAGETTEHITITPTEATEYWVDVTTNGVTCRDYITINVINPEITASATEICAGESVFDCFGEKIHRIYGQLERLVRYKKL